MSFNRKTHKIAKQKDLKLYYSSLTRSELVNELVETNQALNDKELTSQLKNLYMLRLTNITHALSEKINDLNS